MANLGVAGYGAAQELIVLNRDALPLQPRVVAWFFFEGNDLYNDYQFESVMGATHETGATPWTDDRDWTLWPLPDLFAQFCRTEELACLDLTGPLRDSVRAGGMPYAPTDSHWSAEGHELVARALQERLTSLGWLRA